MQRPIKLLGLSVGLGGVFYLIWRWQQSRKWWHQIHFRFVHTFFYFPTTGKSNAYFEKYQKSF